MKNSVFLLICSIFLFSCSSNGGIAIPGEENKARNNIAFEYYQIAEGYYGLKNYSKACEYYVLAGKNEEYRTACQYKLARSYAMNKEWGNAEKLYTELLQKDPDNTDLRLSIAYIYAMDSKTEKALEIYGKLAEDFPENQAVLENYISLLMSLEKTEEARTVFHNLKEKFPDSKIISKYQDTLSEKEKDPAQQPSDQQDPSLKS